MRSTVRDVMTTSVLSVPGDAPFTEVARVLFTGGVRAVVLELARRVSGPDVSLLVQVDTEQGRLYPGLDVAGLPDVAATAAACDFLVGELLASEEDRS